MPKKKRLFINLGISLWFLAVILLFFPLWPHFYYRLSPNASAKLAQTLAEIPTTPTPTLPNTPNDPLPPQITLPPFDPTLPTKNGLIIDTIGIRGEIHEGNNWQELLTLGIWRVPNFATPDQSETTKLPVILAAHRWGYLSWSAAFRKLNSFYNLPKLRPGDKVSLVWDQRQYTYQVYATNQGTHITDYSANLILYTCQLWNSPIRIFVYAKRIS
jgi:sortase (surface protein transpeptidase)